MKSESFKIAGRAINKNFARRFASVGFLGCFISALLGAVLPSRACGPFFPNNLLSGGDDVFTAVPYANFRRELALLELAPARFNHVAPTNDDFALQTADAETIDLTAALRQAKIPDGEAVVTVVAYQKNRSKLNDYVRAMDTWAEREAGPLWRRSSDGPTNAPVLPKFDRVPGLPGEFADYFAGAIAWRANPADTNGARQAWQQLLERPAAERKFRSVWAAYMLGKSWEHEDAEQAARYFRLTRELAQQRFADSIGLAAASYGWEARVELQRKNYRQALKLYVEQYTGGDAGAAESLRVTAQAVFFGENPEVLTELARDPQLRAVFTAYLISDRLIVDLPTGESREMEPVEYWLNAVEAAGVKDVAAAERLALAAYQAAEYELASRWAKRAKSSPLARWVQAKLLLRDGKVGSAAVIFSELVKEFPPVSVTETNRPELLDRLKVDSRYGRDQMRGEWGTLALSRGDYTEALDALLHAGFWEDAAYVAERVLTADELKEYVDANWPEERIAKSAGETVAAGNNENALQSEAASADSSDEVFYDAPENPDIGPEQLRYLLARRLVRESRGWEAMAYFPKEWRESARELLRALDAGWGESGSKEERARSLFIAARIARTNGLELLGTELEPDWAIHGGDFDYGLTPNQRHFGDETTKINRATEAEFQRAARHRADPDERFHYRYHAAALAWEAAKLLPNNSDETARVLCMGGTWLKYRDLDAADVFYKTLVRRCRKTAIGAQADQMRWFPVLDENGNPKPVPPMESGKDIDVGEPVTPQSEATTDGGEEFPIQAESNPEKMRMLYIVGGGDTLLSIAHAASTSERIVTVRSLVDANPGIDLNQLRIGQRLRIPLSGGSERKHVGIAPEVPNEVPSEP